MSNFASQSKHGFTLVEVAIVLLIVGLTLGMILNVTGSMRDTQNRLLIRTQLETIDTALANFVALNKRLPCPANGLLATGAAGAGIETISPGPPPPLTPPKGNCNPVDQANGVLPWVTLGLSESDATDPWRGRITYRVDPTLAQGAPLPFTMDLSNCDPSSSGPAVGVFPNGTCSIPVSPCAGSASCTSPSNFLAGKGLDVWDGVNAAPGWAVRQNNRGIASGPGTGAAYVIISHGPTGAGAYNGNGILQLGTVLPGTNEIPNQNGNPIALPSALATTYRDAVANDTVTTAHFDDYLSHPTIMSVLNKANLGPRAH